MAVYLFPFAANVDPNFEEAETLDHEVDRNNEDGDREE